MAAGDKNYPNIFGMSYNSARDELILADNVNNVVFSMRVGDTAGDLRDVYRVSLSSLVYSVCYMSYSDTLLVCSGEYGLDKRLGKWLVALSRNRSEWREAHRVQTDVELVFHGHISGPLSGSRVLIGEYSSKRMELFPVEIGPRIGHVHRINVPEKYFSFSATSGSDTLVAMCYFDHSVRVHRLLGDELQELAHIQLKAPNNLLWLADRLLVADFDNHKNSLAVIELELSDTRLERRGELIAISEQIRVSSLCAVKDGLAIFDLNSRDILHYSFFSTLPLSH